MRERGGWQSFSRMEILSLEIRNRQERRLGNVPGNSEDLGCLLFVNQVQGRPSSADATRPQRQHQRPGRGQDRPIMGGLAGKRLIFNSPFETGDDKNRHFVQVIGQIFR